MSKFDKNNYDMKTIFTTLAITTSVILFAQQSPPSVEWTQNYNINNTSAYNVALDNNNNVIFITEDISTDKTKLK